MQTQIMRSRSLSNPPPLYPVNMKNKILAVFVATSLSAFATDKLVLEDFDYAISGNSNVSAPGAYLAAFWGSYSGDVFTPVSGGVNAGYFGLGGDDSLASFSTTTNIGTVVAGSTLYLGIFDVASGSPFSSVTDSTARVILSDPTWIAPTFNTSPGSQTVELTSNTTAVFGNYTFGAGNQTIGLVAVPEPSSFAALAGFAVLGLAASRRRRA